jgi:hypothetical protein
MAFDIGQFFGTKKKRADLSPITKVGLPSRSLTDFPTGSALNERILAGLRGEGIGFDPRFVERTTSPVVAQREARFREVERPELESAFSARGLGRSTIAGREIGRAGAQVGRDINQIIADAFLAQEQQKKADIARIQNLAFGFTGAEAGQEAVRLGEEGRRAGIEVGAQQAADIQSRQNLNQLIASAFAAITDPRKLPDIFSGQQGGGDSSASFERLLELAKQARTAGQARAFTGGSPLQQAGGPLSFAQFAAAA